METATLNENLLNQMSRNFVDDDDLQEKEEEHSDGMSFINDSFAYFRALKLEGVNRTKRTIIEAALEESGMYEAETRKELFESMLIFRKNLAELGIFESVHISLDEAPSDYPRGVDIIMDAQESGIGSFGANINSGNDGSIGGTSIDAFGTGKNAFGYAETISTTFKYHMNSSNSFKTSFSRKLYALGLFQYWNMNLEMFHSLSNKGQYSSFSELARGVSFGFASPNKSHSFRYLFSHRDLDLTTSIDDVSPEIVDQVGTSIISSIGYKFHKSTLDHPIVPSTGFKINVDTSFAGLGGLGDVKYSRMSAKLRHYFPLTRPFFEGVANSAIVIGSGVDIGVLQPYGGDFSHVLDRFNLGGLSSMKGFRSRGIGPRGTPAGSLPGDSLGGDYKFMCSLGMHLPIPNQFLSQMGARCSIFGQVGNLVSHSTTLEDMIQTCRKSIGCGVSMPIPLGFGLNNFRFEFNVVRIIQSHPSDVLGGRYGWSLGISAPF